jgi:hypothetical protein
LSSGREPHGFGALGRHADSALGATSPGDRERPTMAPRLPLQLGMTKPSRKLVLRTETISPLTQEALRGVGGGFIMQDTVIIRTGRIVAPDAEIQRP